MPDLKVSSPPPAPVSASAARLKVIQDAKTRPETVKVYPASEVMQRVLRHPNGTRFRSSLDQAVEWPNDSFTTRRIRDGSVLTDGPASGKPEPDDPKLSVRERAHARTTKPAKPAEDKDEKSPGRAHPSN